MSSRYKNNLSDLSKNKPLRYLFNAIACFADCFLMSRFLRPKFSGQGPTWAQINLRLSKWAYAQTAALEGCLTLAPGSEAAVWDNWSAKIWRNYGVHVSPKMCGPLCIHLRNPLQNQWQNDGKSMKIYVGGCLLSHVGSKWHLLEAILAQDDREDRFFIDF